MLQSLQTLNGDTFQTRDRTGTLFRLTVPALPWAPGGICDRSPLGSGRRGGGVRDLLDDLGTGILLARSELIDSTDLSAGPRLLGFSS